MASTPLAHGNHHHEWTQSRSSQQEINLGRQSYEVETEMGRYGRGNSARNHQQDEMHDWHMVLAPSIDGGSCVGTCRLPCDAALCESSR